MQAFSNDCRPGCCVAFCDVNIHTCNCSIIAVGSNYTIGSRIIFSSCVLHINLRIECAKSHRICRHFQSITEYLLAMFLNNFVKAVCCGGC